VNGVLSGFLETAAALAGLRRVDVSAMREALLWLVAIKYLAAKAVCLPYESPKLQATMNMSATDLAERMKLTKASPSSSTANDRSRRRPMT